MPNLAPFLLLFGGFCFALYYAAISILEPTVHYALEFAVASLVAVIGWGEIRASDESND